MFVFFFSSKAKETCFQLGMGTNIHGTELIPGDDQTDAGKKFLSLLCPIVFSPFDRHLTHKSVF